MSSLPAIFVLSPVSTSDYGVVVRNYSAVGKLQGDVSIVQLTQAYEFALSEQLLAIERAAVTLGQNWHVIHRAHDGNGDESVVIVVGAKNETSAKRFTRHGRAIVARLIAAA